MHAARQSTRIEFSWERLEMKRTTTLLGFLTLLIIAGAMSMHVQGQSQSGYGEAVPAGVRVLVGLQSTLDTKVAKAGDPFHARTLEPLTMANGRVLPPGMEIRGHVDKAE